MRWIILSVGLVVGDAALVFVPVPVGAEAVVTRGGNIDRVLGPGVHRRVPGVERVEIYRTLIERQMAMAILPALDGNWRDLASCNIAVELIYRIGDVRALHEAGGSVDLPPSVAGVASAALTDISSEVADRVGAARAAVFAAVEEAMPAGLMLTRVTVDLGDCA